MRTALDTNVLAAIWGNEPSVPILLPKLGRAESEGALLICPLVSAELHAHPWVSAQDLDRLLESTRIAADTRVEQQVWREAGLRYRSYSERRRRSGGGSPRRLLADFVIGAHALLQADRLLTLDSEIYARNFPELILL